MNLIYILQIFILFFFTKPKLKKSVKVTLEGGDDDEYILDEDNRETEDQDIAVIEEAVMDAEDDDEDDGQVEVFTLPHSSVSTKLPGKCPTRFQSESPVPTSFIFTKSNQNLIGV
ncbi:hypothetical protein CVT25_006880 [Psilocybe cyanescens]|uniref:Uncharacterized protein n=1 Tax=Psilocybe cyanescens TaxID=93625 RepID=A0A409X471_PSICY|nr:hypothetical protein CVT25_006880 [Psilocybe cyanescens]